MAVDCTLDAVVADGSEHVTLSLTVSNDGDEPLDLTFPTAQRVEVTVRDGDEDVWRFGDGRMFAQVVETDRLDAGDATTYAVEWPVADVAPGEYTATATLAADADCVASTTVTLGT